MPGRPVDVIRQEMINRVWRLARNDCQIKAPKFASECGTSNGVNIYAINHFKSICQVGTEKTEHVRSSTNGGVKSSKVKNFRKSKMPIQKTLISSCNS